MSVNTSTVSYHSAVDGVRAGIQSVKGSSVSTLEITEDTCLWNKVDGEQCVDLDSLDLLHLIIYLEEEFGWIIGDDKLDASEWRTVGELAVMVIQTTGGAPSEMPPVQ
jgi:acyl carrier protein